MLCARLTARTLERRLGRSALNNPRNKKLKFKN